MEARVSNILMQDWELLKHQALFGVVGFEIFRIAIARFYGNFRLGRKTMYEDTPVLHISILYTSYCSHFELWGSVDIAIRIIPRHHLSVEARDDNA